jgi:hypothetical protein
MFQQGKVLAPHTEVVDSQYAEISSIFSKLVYWLDIPLIQ